MGTRRIGFIGFEGANAFDLSGPVEVFAAANDIGKAPAYDIWVLAPGGQPFTCESGLVFMPRAALADAPDLDTVIVPGGAGLRRDEAGGEIETFLRERAPATRRIASVCTGAFGLAAAGLLDGRRVTTHWRWARDLARRYPGLALEPDRIFVEDGPIFTSGGMSAGVDLALALVEADLGPRMALAIAREMVVYVKRTGGQSQYSEPLKAQVRAPDRLAELVAWMSNNLDADLGVEAMARRVAISPRQLARMFSETLGVSPGAYVERLRLDAAREQLVESDLSIEAVAAITGYRSADVFRRAFERTFGVSPLQYRRGFAGMSEFVGEVS